ncbi:transcriptional regulator, XRE family with cupin sensor [Burkholderia sp. D7]|nr:transcriptional regulator, XRE family with cupin sensor [Burkholderia sp. D7]
MSTIGPPDNSNELGQRLRALRLQMGMTLSEVSHATGVSTANLSKIENNHISPSFDIIKKVCEGMQISIEEFVRPGEKKSLVSGRKTITRLNDGGRFTSGQYDYKAHATELTRKGMVPLEMRVRARAVEEFDHWSRHTGEEFVYVLSGAIEVHTRHYSPFRLEKAESAYFDSDMEHLYISVSPEDAHILSVSYDPAGHEKVQIKRFMNPAAQSVVD